MSLIKNHLEKIMSDFHEIALRRYDEEQDQLYREALEREQNPEYYWHIVTSHWDDYAYTEEEANTLVELAKKEGLKLSCTKHFKRESYQ